MVPMTNTALGTNLNCFTKHLMNFSIDWSKLTRVPTDGSAKGWFFKRWISYRA